MINHTSRANFEVNATQQSRQIQEKRIKIMVTNLGMKHKYETMLEVIRDLVLDFVLYFVTDKVPFACNFSTEYNKRYIIHHIMSTKC